ncbi:purple acid phosphatase family protein [Pseudomonas matsuisoli]|uniref:Phosphoesterase n=1 Tax=Pseudomonas matsuisoli TaxID=1515666 RepID=A0A917PPE1_9PSED|nr:metallophosphoesterase family protein [Pseudomonas matsuisoli]GGJ86382.1 phosphoesterase [Pseudomonas matsuisoli]
MYRSLLLTTMISAMPFCAMASATAAPPHSPGVPYAAGVLPDRVVLTPGADPATEMGVAFRTAIDQPTAELQYGPAIAGPNVVARVERLSGSSHRLDTENGSALYHQVRLEGLTPDTPYAYRVKGSAGWSEWHQFRTAKATAAPFAFIYLGDTQNDILAVGSRTIRQALQSIARPALMVHAGDLVSQRDDLVHDDEWGEWNQAGGFALSAIPQLTAAGNHEYVDHFLPNGEETRLLGPHYPLQFTTPPNGVEGLGDTTYFTDYQGVRFIVLDGTSAIDLGSMDAQTAWLEQTLQSSNARWNVVVMHQPIYTCARPEDTTELKEAWQPLFDQYRVDLVLQGHDHCYSRLTDESGRKASSKARQADEAVGPVYMVSVTGSKMYGLNDRAQRQPDRVAEDTQLYQTVEVETDRLKVRAYAVNGVLYDAFDIVRTEDGRNRLHEIEGDTFDERVCRGESGPDGLPCTARGK